jgi:molybdopterin-guanine dinucleotide biosynthesis protein A
MDDVAIVLLAGGQARRFPGKLEHLVDGEPMLARSLERMLACGWPVFIAAQGSFAADLDRRLTAPLLIDRRPGGGPLAALLSACAAIRARRIFAVAADQPRLEASVLREIAQSWRANDEALVPRHDGGAEPLTALYARNAILREGFALLRSGANAMHDLLEKVAARFLTLDAAHFYNVNYESDLA